MTVEMPSSRPMRSAVIRLSPLNITTSTPCSWSAATAALAVGLGASLIPIRPAARRSIAIRTTVLPSPAI